MKRSGESGIRVVGKRSSLAAHEVPGRSGVSDQLPRGGYWGVGDYIRFP